jgi:hypothetical protein
MNPIINHSGHNNFFVEMLLQFFTDKFLINIEKYFFHINSTITWISFTEVTSRCYEFTDAV